MARRGVSDDEILAAIEALVAREVEPQSRLIRQELGNTGDYSRIQGVLENWRGQRAEQRSITVPDIPDTVNRTLQAIWPTAYKAADDLLETKRTALEGERLRYEQDRTEMLEEISGLENTRDTLEATAEAHAAELQRLRQELEQARRDLAASEAKAQTLAQQLDTIRSEQQGTLTTLQDWMERAATAEAELKARQTVAAPKKSSQRKRRQSSEPTE